MILLSPGYRQGMEAHWSGAFGTSAWLSDPLSLLILVSQALPSLLILVMWGMWLPRYEPKLQGDGDPGSLPPYALARLPQDARLSPVCTPPRILQGMAFV